MKNLTAGSHIKTSRPGYSHHGIYCGNGKVIHYSGFAQALKKGALEVTTLERFLGSETEYHIVQYPSHKLRYSKSEIVVRAFSRLGENSYNLAFNNCEHFATWCVTGKGESKQVRSALTYTTTAAASYHSIRKASTAAQVVGLAAKTLSGTTASRITVGRLAGCASGAIGGAALSASGAAVGTTALVGATGAVSGTTALSFIATGAAATAAAPIALPVLAVVGAGAVIGGLLGGFFD